MPYFADNQGRPFAGMRLSANPRFTPPSGSPSALTDEEWDVRDHPTENGRAQYQFNRLPDEGYDYFLRGGSTSEPWEPIDLTGYTLGEWVTIPFTMPVGVLIKFWSGIGVDSDNIVAISDLKEIIVYNTTPVVTNVVPTATSTTVQVAWHTTGENGVCYFLVNQNSSATKAEVRSGGPLDVNVPVSAAGQQSPAVITGLSTETSYYVHVMHEDAILAQSDVVSSAFTTEEAPSGTVVSSYEECLAAVNNPAVTNILLAPGIYSHNGNDGWIVMFRNRNRTSNPLTVQSEDPSNPAIFRTALQFGGSKHITFKNFTMLNVSWGDNATHMRDAGGAATNITIDGITFDGETSWISGGLSITSPASSSNSYGNTAKSCMAYCLRFENAGTKNYTVKNCIARYCWSFGNFYMNGSVTIENNTVDIWYYDCFRFFPSTNGGSYTRADRYVIYNKFLRCIGWHNEISYGVPHPDMTQAQGSGYIEDLMFYQNILAGGDLRGSLVQAGLQNCGTRNLAYVENIWLTKKMQHGVWYSGSSTIYRGGLHERQTYGDSNWSSAVTVRAQTTETGHILIKDSLLRGIENYSTTGKLQLEIINSTPYPNYADTFVGPARPGSESEARTSFTPKGDQSGRGALTTIGEFRNLPHVPTMPNKPTVTGGSGQAILTTVHAPTLMSPKQASQGGATITRYDVQWSTSANTGTWTIVTNKPQGSVVTGLPSGTVYFQTRCVNTAGEGVWSEWVTATIS